MKLAVTSRAFFIVTLQVPVPPHAPDQPANLEPPVGVAARDTLVPDLWLSRQSPGQLIPGPAARLTVSG